MASWPWSQEARAGAGETGPRGVLKGLLMVEEEEEEVEVEGCNMIEGIIW